MAMIMVFVHWTVIVLYQSDLVTWMVVKHMIQWETKWWYDIYSYQYFCQIFKLRFFFGKIRCDHENLRYKTRTNHTDVWLVVRVEFRIKEVILKKILLMFSFVKFNKTSGNVVMTCLFKFNFKPLKLFRHSICNEH